jgi:hypothetical protein
MRHKSDEASTLTLLNRVLPQGFSWAEAGRRLEEGVIQTLTDAHSLDVPSPGCTFFIS